MKLLKHWHPFTGLLHFSIAFFVTTSMLSSLLPTTPSFLLTFTYIHGTSGCFLTLSVIAHWIWNFCYNRGEMLRHLFPYRAQDHSQITNDIRGLIRGKLPPRGRPGGLPGLIEGLGLLAVTAMVLTGPFLLVDILINKGFLSPRFYDLKEIHTFFAIFIWIYWIGHVSMALIAYIYERRTSK